MRRLITALIMAAAWLAAVDQTIAAPNAQKQAIQAVRDLKGTVVRDRDLPDHPVVSVSLANTQATDKSLIEVGQFHELCDLNLANTKVTDAGLRQLDQLKNLRKLNLFGTQVSNNGIATAAAAFPALEELSVNGRSLTDYLLRSVVGLRDLRVLRLGLSVRGKGLQQLQQMPSLRVLDLSGVQCSRDVLRQLRGCKQLTELELDCNGEVRDAELAEIAALPGIEKLYLFSEGITDNGVAALAGLKTLRSVYLRGHAVTRRGLAPLQGLPNLEEIQLYLVQDGCLQAVTKFPRLRSFLSDQVTDAVLHDISRNLPHLRRLNLAYSKISDEGVKELVDLTELEELDLTAAAITDAGLAHLSRLKQLRSLNLEACSLTNKGLSHLEDLSELRWLKVPGDASGAELKELPRLPHLEYLDMSCSRVTDEGVRQLQAFKALAVLHVCGTEITDDGLKQMARLGGLRELTMWQVSGVPVKFSNAGFQRLQESLPYTAVVLH